MARNVGYVVAAIYIALMVGIVLMVVQTLASVTR